MSAASRSSVQALRDLRRSAVHVVELCDVVIFREASSDATLARARLHSALPTLIRRAQRAIDALDGTP
jgi:hypothetical protein